MAGRILHAPLIVAAKGFELRGVVTSDQERNVQAQGDLPLAKVFGSSDAAWSLAGEFDIAVIATATASHLPLALKALQCGMHVVIEKPVAGNSEDFSTLTEAAHAAGRQVHVFQNRRWDSDFLTLRGLIDSGSLGKLHRLESRMESLRERAKISWRDSPRPEHFGGVLLDLGSHLVDQALEIMGPVLCVSAHARSIRNIEIADDDMQMVLTHESGAISTLIASKAAAFSGPRFTVLGTHGAVRIDALDSQESELRSGKMPGSDNWGVEPPSAFATLRTIRESKVVAEETIPLKRGCWDSYYPSVRDAIMHGKPAPVPLSDVGANMRVLDAARLAASRGKSVSLLPLAGHDSEKLRLSVKSKE
jgi:scyllo-inositol 2-dehydrogenase (NADP+)